LSHILKFEVDYDAGRTRGMPELYDHKIDANN